MRFGGLHNIAFLMIAATVDGWCSRSLEFGVIRALPLYGSMKNANTPGTHRYSCTQANSGGDLALRHALPALGSQ
jgi:hypothetical protein